MSVPSKQKILALPEKGADFVVTNSKVPTPQPGEILVKVEATALNPVDWKVAASGRFYTEWPAILGVDTAGVVAALGEGVTNFAVGDRILHEGNFVNRHAGFQQYNIALADLCCKIPSNISFDEATLPLGVATAAIALYSQKVPSGGAALTPPWEDGGLGKYAGEPIVVFGGASSVGVYTLQLAKLSGFSPIIATASSHNSDFVKSQGATHVVDRKLPSSELMDQLKEIAGKPIKYIRDCISSPETMNQGYDALSSGGVLIHHQPSHIEESKLTADKECVSPFGSWQHPVNKELGFKFYRAFPKLIETGAIKPNEVAYISGGLASIPEALDRLKNGSVSAEKIVVRPTETQ